MPEPKTPGAVRLLARNGVIDLDEAAREAVGRAWGLRFADAKRMLEWAELAAELASSDETRILALEHLGNAHRINGNFSEARRFLDLAKDLQSEPDALLLEFRATLFENLGAFDDAVTCLRAAGRLRGHGGESDGEAKVLTSIGHVLTEAGRHYEAAQVFRAALDSLDTDSDVLRIASHGLAHALARSGQPAAALAVLEEAREALEEGGFLFRLRVSWLLGRIAMLCGVDDLAVANLEVALEGFRRAELAHETCLITLDLAVNDARRGRIEAALRLLQPIPDLLTQIGVPVQADTAAAVRLLLAGRVDGALEHLEKVISAVEG